MTTSRTSCPYVWLLLGKEVVGTGKYFFQPGVSSPAKSIHGGSLLQFECNGPDPVAICQVLIFQEHEGTSYPFRFTGPDGYPKKLGDLNDPTLHFKAIVAWDGRNLIPNSHGKDLGADVEILTAASQRRRITEVLSSRAPAFLITPALESARMEIEGPPGKTAVEEDRIEPVEGTGPDVSVGNYHVEREPEDSHAHHQLPVDVIMTDEERDDEADSTMTGDGKTQDRDEMDEDLDGEGVDESAIDESMDGNVRNDVAGGSRRAISSQALPEDVNRATGKRRYTYRERKRAPPQSQKLSNRRQEWLELSRRSDNPFLKNRTCCRKLKCFKHTEPVFAFAQYRRFFLMDTADRKRALISMLDDDRHAFRFNGKIVCTRFLTKAFKFSGSLQTSVKGTPGAPASASPSASPREVRGTTISDEIVIFLRRLAECLGDNIPNMERVNLPMLSKLEVYEEFCKDFHQKRGSVDGVQSPSKNYFYAVWKKECKNIKVYRYTGFTICARCEMIRSKLVETVHDESSQSQYRREWKAHFNMVREERRGYARRAGMAMRQPSEYCSLILDGADQQSYGLPHMRIDTKSDRGHKIKVKCVGALEHRSEKRLTLFTMTEEFQSGANHVIEVAHRVLQAKKNGCLKLPKTLFVQVDNTCRENKNKYFMGYFEMLVARGVFLEVQVSFLPVGHTHADVDQAFSAVATRLRHADAVTMDDLLSLLRGCFRGYCNANRLDSVANFSGLCDNSNCLANVRNITDFRFFKFVRDENANHPISGSYFATCCSVKRSEDDEWVPLPVIGPRSPTQNRTTNGFLLFVPDLESIPPTETRVPNNVVEVNKCLESMEERIRSQQKMQELVELKNRVYTPRTDQFSWDLAHSFETNGDYRASAAEQSADNSVSHGEEEGEPVDNVTYNANDFVAVKTSDEESTPFWIAQVIRVHRFDRSNRPVSLFVRWYIPARTSRDPFSSAYVPAKRRVEGRDVAYTGNVDVRCILVTFASLSTRDRLQHSTRIALRSALDM